jgi:AraC-like DNA-binding protein
VHFNNTDFWNYSQDAPAINGDVSPFVHACYFGTWMAIPNRFTICYDPIGKTITADRRFLRRDGLFLRIIVNAGWGGRMSLEEQAQVLREELKGLLQTLAPEEGDVRYGHGVTVYRRDNPTPLHHGESAICFGTIAQGKRHVAVGKREWTFTSDCIFITTMKVPIVSNVIEASPEKPFLSLSVELNPGEVKSVYMEAEPEALGRLNESGVCGITPNHLQLLDATVRLMRVINEPHDAGFLAPMIKREIIFLLLTTDHDERLRQIAGMNTVSNRIKAALDHLREDLHQPLRVSEIAERTGMSVSSFHEHFKNVTGMTPLQYQKQLRLREARHMLLTQDIDAAGAGYSVGYSDASHFNRDYKRLFGKSPMRDMVAQRSEQPESQAS